MNDKALKKKIKNSRGITMISLVVIIIILIILAGVSSEILIGKNGIVTRAEKSREEQKIAELSEKLELVKAPTQVDKLDTVITVDEYLEELQQPNAVDFSVDEIERVDEDNAYVTVADKYVFLVEYKEDKTLIITYQGKAKELKPRITKIELSNTTNSITAKVEATRAEKYKFYIKDKIDGEYEYKEENKKGEYTYSNLGQNKEYYIKIEAINKNGQVEREVKRTTGGMPELTVGELISTTTPEGWINRNKTTKIEIRTDKDVTGVRLQYTKLPENATTEDYKKAQWMNYTSNGIESEKNETIAIRLWDGTNATSRMAIKVEKIDKTVPIITETTANTNTITIKATDEASGIIGYTVTENTTEPTNFTSYTSTKTLNVNVGNKTQGKTYYVWVKDAAGNVSAYKQVGTGTVTKSEGNITFTYSTTNWTNKDITVTAKTTITGYKLQTSTDAKTWKDTTSQTLSANGKVYARLADSTNQATGYAVATVDKIDKTKPIVTSATANTNTITIKATDEASGIIGYTVTENTTEPTNFTSYTSTKTLNVNVGNKTQGKTYYVWVKDAAGNVSAYKQVGTGTVTKSEGNITFTYSTTNWTNKDITVTAKTTITGYKLQTSTDAKTWKDTTSQTLSANGKVYARLADSTNQATGYAVATVDKIDKTKPIVTSATANTNTITIKATDEASGIIGYTVTENTTEPTNFTSYTSTKTLNVNVGNKTQGKTYYVWVKDAAGNVSAYKQVGTTSVTPSAGNITFGVANWNNGKASTTISTTSSYTIKYQKNSTTGTWIAIKNGGSISNLSHGDKIYAKLVDSTEQTNGNYAVLEIKDTVVPESAIITISGTTTQTTLPIKLNAKVTHTDNESEIAIESSRYVLNTNSSEIGTIASSYTGGKFSSNEENITISPNAIGKWYLHVLSVDNAGNAKETIKGPIQITTKYHKHTGYATNGGGCYETPIYKVHTHISSCYSTQTVRSTCQCGAYNGRYLENGAFVCMTCGHSGHGPGGICGASITSTQTIIVCGKTQGQRYESEGIENYSLSCGKTETTIEGYTITY